MSLRQRDTEQRQTPSFLVHLALAGLLALCGSTRWTVWAQGIVPEVKEPEGEQEAEDCIKCHLKVNPAVVYMFQASTMGKRGIQNQAVYDEVKRQRAPKEKTETRKGFLVRNGQISCVLCHGNDHTVITETNGRVADAACGGCHDTVDKEYEKGGGHSFDKPGENWTRALEDPEYAGLPMPILQLSRDLRFSQQGATAPPYFDHDPEYERSGLVLRNGCDSCHTRHRFSTAEARKPEACKTCHAGAGDTVYDAYLQSKHGSLYIAHQQEWDWEMPLPEAYARGEYKTPTCAYCHMLLKERYGSVRSTHDMTRKSIWNRGLQPLVVGETRVEEGAYRVYLQQVRSQAEPRRAEMILVCRNCHSEKFAKRYLNAADEVKLSSDLLVLSARTIVDRLVKERIVEPFPTLTALEGNTEAQTTGTANRRIPSAIERAYLEMARHHNVRTSRGAFHQSPNDVLWNGYLVLENELNRIRELAHQARSQRR